MLATYPFRFGMLRMECEGNVLIRLRCEPGPRPVDEAPAQGGNAFTDEVFRQVEEFLVGE